MMMTMKQGLLLTWSPCKPQFLYKFSQPSLTTQKSVKPNACFTIFARCNGAKRSFGGSASKERRDREAGNLKFDFEFDCDDLSSVSIVRSLFCHQKLIHQAATALLVSNALALSAPIQALAETCEADGSVFDMNMPLLLFVALIGATVGGLLARQRRGELQRLNEQLRQINAALRRQAKIESYAPALSYAPVAGRISENEVIVDPRKQDLISRLKNGKNYLRNQDPEGAFFEFKAALEIAQNLKDSTEEKKAARGLGASLQRQGKYRDAIKYHTMVLEISQREGEDSGNAEAYGAIADCYTELGDLERAAKYYDQYISRLQSD